MSWGTSADRANIPGFIPDHLKDSVFLGTAGWYLPAAGTANRAAGAELLVALSTVDLGNTGAEQDEPTVFTGGQTVVGTMNTLTGISGVAITPYLIDVFDLEDRTISGGITWSEYPTLPSGLTLSVYSEGDNTFQITGTPGATAAGNIAITFADSNGATDAILIPYSITEE